MQPLPRNAPTCMIQTVAVTVALERAARVAHAASRASDMHSGISIIPAGICMHGHGAGCIMHTFDLHQAKTPSKNKVAMSPPIVDVPQSGCRFG